MGAIRAREGLHRHIPPRGTYLRRLETFTDAADLTARARPQRRATNLPGSGAAAHPANHFIAGKAVLHHPRREPIDINRIRQVPRRLLS